MERSRGGTGTGGISRTESRARRRLMSRGRGRPQEGDSERLTDLLKEETKRLRYQVIYTRTFLLVLLLAYISLDISSSWRTERDLDIQNKTSRKYEENLTRPNELDRKQTHISYLKTPKTGSSTMACIFLRFGFKNKLTMYIPRQGFVTETMKKHLLAKRKHFDIFVIHTIYDHHFFTHIVKDPAIIGEIRDPEQRIISDALFSYHRRGLKEFRNMRAQECLNKIVTNTTKYRRQNILSRFFGIPASAQHNKDILQMELQKINKAFLLILILEKIDESLILMKRLLNWSFADIIYGKRKVNHHKTVSLNVTQKEHFRHTNKLDFNVYEFFLNELNEKIRNAGNEFESEVRYFKYVLKQVKLFCEENSTTSVKISFLPTRWGSEFVVLKEDCTMIYKYDVGRLKSIFRKV